MKDRGKPSEVIGKLGHSENLPVDRRNAAKVYFRWWRRRRREHPFATRFCAECGHDVTSHRRLSLAGGKTVSRCFDGLCNCSIPLGLRRG